MKNRGPDGMRNLRPQRLSFQDKRRVMSLYREGMSMREISKIFGVGKTAIYYFLHSRGEPVRPKRDDPQKYNGKTGPKPGGVTVTERDEFGITVTLRRQDTLELHSMHVPGKRMEALRHLAALIDRSGVDWKIFSYSTPETIAGDLAKKRVQEPDPDAERRMPTYIQSIEANVLGRIKRLDLLDPALDLGERRGQNR